MSISKTILIGNMGKPIEVRTAQSGKRFGSFSLATTKKWKDKNGEKQSKTSWHNISVFQDGLVGVLEQYTRKGSKLYLEGELDYQEYEKDGQKKYITKIIASQIQLLDSKSDSQDVHKPDYNQDTGGNDTFTPAKAADLDDEIMF